MATIPSQSLGQIAEFLNAELRGDAACAITGIAPLDKAKSGDISFLYDPKYRVHLNDTQASAVILSPKEADLFAGNRIIIENPYLCYSKMAAWLAPLPEINTGIHPTAVIGAHCQIAPTARIGAHCVIGDHVTIGANTVIHPGCTIGEHSTLGDDCLLYAHVTLYHRVRIGNKAIIHSGVVIGADGFGYVNDKGVWHKVPQIGGVVIGNDVEIGANTTIDRGALGDTIIEDGVKLDNLIQIAHNVRIGAHTAIAGTTGIAGSADIGKYCMIGGGVAIGGHLKIVDQVILTARAEVASSILKPGIYSSGIPAHPNREWRKNIIRLLQLDDIVRRLKKLEKDTL